ncbi:MAG: ShlB/FhaC/HecB family hemolysin secretion/activation protein [Deltaproteobacteria bacterium]|nr:ShlB/FhaC/HecB family hemolysin secretion/activation protein [Deltaproteobacteria bacterium]
MTTKETAKEKAHYLRRGKRVGSMLLAFTGLLMLSMASYAQEKSGEVLKQLEKKETLPAEKPAAPVIQQQKDSKEQGAESQGEKIHITKITVQGATLLDQTVLDTIIAPYQNKDLTLAEINAAADAITAAYRAKGFLAAYAYIPAQDIKDGIIIIQVIEAKTGNITITGNQNYTTAFIQGHLQKVQQAPTIKEQTLERALMLLNDYPSLNVNGALKPGTEPGTTDIAITATDKYPISATLSYDNFGTETLSKHRLSLVIDKGSTITDGDAIRLSGVTGLDRIDINKLSYGRIDYILPIDYNGTKAGIYYGNSLYQAGQELAPLKINGKADITGLFITHPIIKKADTTLLLKFGFDYKDVYDYMLDSIRSQDKIRTIGLGINYDTTDNLLFNQTARNIIGLSYYRSVQTITGGTGRNDAKASRLNADPEFNKYTLDIVRIQKLTNNGYNHLIIKASGQYSPEPLFIAEQYTIGGAGSVRGFKPSTFSGDSGYNVTLEFQTSPIFSDETISIINNQKIGDTIKLALFIDNGWVQRNNRQPGEAEDDDLLGIGAGIRLYIGKNFSAKIDYALPEKKGDFKTENSEIYAQAAVGF